MLICPWWRHSRKRLHMIVRRDKQREREREGVGKTGGREVKLYQAVWEVRNNSMSNREREVEEKGRPEADREKWRWKEMRGIVDNEEERARAVTADAESGG